MVALAAHVGGQSDVVTVLLAALATLQTIALAVIADRSRRVRRWDPSNGEGRPERAPDGPWDWSA